MKKIKQNFECLDWCFLNIGLRMVSAQWVYSAGLVLHSVSAVHTGFLQLTSTLGSGLDSPIFRVDKGHYGSWWGGASKSLIRGCIFPTSGPEKGRGGRFPLEQKVSNI